MRLSRYLSLAGVASRRKAEQIIASGRVEVNGDVVTLPQHRVGAGDRVTVDGREVEPAEEKYYLILDKPAGYLSTASDPHGRPTVLDIIGKIPARLYPVGRLDLDTTGVLLLTN
ncbi:MAG TPA: S4 domain-containing protein, partial [Bacillota bacterium]|nr:S4 domain-containing protein [Bacillota bacterium]